MFEAGIFQNFTDSSILKWIAPFLYTAFNLAMAQSILIPLSRKTNDRFVLLCGGICGGIGVGLLLLALHSVLYTYYPIVKDHEIPLSFLMKSIAERWQLLFVFVLFSEMFTTITANGYGLALQFATQLRVSRSVLLGSMLLVVYLISLAGFKDLITCLYPLFGGISLYWLFAIFVFRRAI